MCAGEGLNLVALLDLSPATGEYLGPHGDGRMLLVEAPMRSQVPCGATKPGPGVQCALRVTGFSSSSSSSCIMVDARCALTLILLLLALSAQDVEAAPWQAQAVGRWAGQGQHPGLPDPNEQQ